MSNKLVSCVLNINCDFFSILLLCTNFIIVSTILVCKLLSISSMHKIFPCLITLYIDQIRVKSCIVHNDSFCSHNEI